MGFLEVVAHATIRPGGLAAVKAKAAEIVALSLEHDRQTIRCDWFLNEDQTEFEVREMFDSEEGLIEHQQHIMAARMLLFRDFAGDHRSAIFGEVSEEFINLVRTRMGVAPTIYAFLQGLDGSPSVVPPGPGDLEVTARLRVRPGELEGFKRQVAEIMRLSREQDLKTLRYDWFINADGTECEVHEAYVSEDGLVEHNAHVMEARAVLFDKYADDHRMGVYGSISQPLRDLFDQHAGGVRSYAFLVGLQTAAV